MAKLIALQPICHDGKDYAEGDTLDVAGEASIAQLVDAGAAKPKGGKSKAEKAADEAQAAAVAAAEADAAAAAESAARELAESAQQQIPV